MNLERELNDSYTLLKRTYRVDFPRPTLIIDDDELAAHLPDPVSLRDLMRPLPEGLYDCEENIIYLSEGLIQEPRAQRDQRQLTVCHELGHALIAYVNPKLRESAVGALLNGGSASWRERGECYLAFDEGTADWMSVDACRSTGKPGLVSVANHREKQVVELMAKWANSWETGILGDLYGTRDDWKATMIAYCRRTPGVSKLYKYELGYHFAANVRADIVNVIKRPPKNFEQLLYPEKYHSLR